MKYYRLITADGGYRLTVETQNGVLTDLTSLDEDLTELDDLALAASLSGSGIDELAEGIMRSGEPAIDDLSEVMEGSRDGGIGIELPMSP